MDLKRCEEDVVVVVVVLLSACCCVKLLEIDYLNPSANHGPRPPAPAPAESS